METLPYPEGSLIRLQRTQRGWSQDRLLRELRAAASRVGEGEIGATVPMISRWENGRRKPDDRYQRLLDRAFTDSLDPTSDRWEHEMQRRAFLRNAGVAGLALLGGATVTEEPWQRLSAALRRPGRTDAGTVGDLEAVTVSFQELYQRVSPHALLAPVRSHMTTLTRLLEGGGQPDRLRRRLASLAGETAILMGWLSSDDGDHATAQALYQTAVDAAQEAHDSALGAYAIGSASTLPAFRTSPDHTLYLLGEGAHGFRTANATPTTRAWLRSLQAEAHAAAGHEADAFRSLDDAAAVLDEGHDDADDEPRPRVSFFDPTRLAGERGVISVRLGAAEEGRRSLDDALSSLGAGLKIKSRLLTSLARAHLDRGDIERACEIARDSLAVALATETDASVRDLLSLRDEMRRWDQTEAVREFDAALQS